MFTDVVLARELRATVIAERAAMGGLPALYHLSLVGCPVRGCGRPLRSHRDCLPCQRRGEFDRYDIHRG